jgi:cytoskeletal protein CcmA (bactofilin family)
MKTVNSLKNSRMAYKNRTMGRIINAEADIVFNGDLELTGIFSGKLEVNGSLIISKNALVYGEIIVTDLYMYGNIIGTAEVHHKAVIFRGSSFTGTLVAAEADFKTGSRFLGESTIAGVTAEKPMEQLQYFRGEVQFSAS